MKCKIQVLIGVAEFAKTTNYRIVKQTIQSALTYTTQLQTCLYLILKWNNTKERPPGKADLYYDPTKIIKLYYITDPGINIAPFINPPPVFCVRNTRTTHRASFGTAVHSNVRRKQRNLRSYSAASAVVRGKLDTLTGIPISALNEKGLVLNLDGMRR